MDFVGPVGALAVEEAQDIVGVVAAHPPAHEVVLDGDEDCAGRRVAGDFVVEIAAECVGYDFVGVHCEYPVVGRGAETEVAVSFGDSVFAAGLDDEPDAVAAAYFVGGVGAFHVHDEDFVEVFEGAQDAVEMFLGIVGVDDGCYLRAGHLREGLNSFLNRRLRAMRRLRSRKALMARGSASGA